MTGALSNLILEWMRVSLYSLMGARRYDITLNNFLLHMPNHALNDLHMLNDK